MLVIGITGGVASGKSLVALCFKHFGAQVLDADRVGHEVLKDPNVIAAIHSQWGEIVLKDGEVDRGVLGKIVFEPTPSGSNSLRRLEQITHPLIGARIRQRLSELKADSNCSAVVLDAPIMFKANWDQMCDKIVFVHTDPTKRQQRSRQRGWDSEELSKRESRQISVEEKRLKSTDTIDNSDSREETYFQACDLWQAWGLRLPEGLEFPNTLFKN
ncbi:MAG: dephospho-CoA kinase [Mariniblastus sp.]|nr:dephospho-CoA kinase [Mariniblastus sp.]